MKQTNNSKKTNQMGGQRNLPATTKVTPRSQYIHASKPSSSSIDQQSWWKALHFSERVLLPLRLFLGITFLYAGIQKLTDPQFFNPSATGFIGRQIMAFAHGSPIQNVLLHVALPHAVFAGAIIAVGEMAIGIGTLLGFLFRPAAFFGMLLSLLFFLSASWHVYPYFYGADIVFFFAWTPLLLAGPLGSGLPSIDAVLVRRILMDMSPESRGRMEAVFNFFLGVGGVVEKQNVSLEEVPTQAVNRIHGQGAQYNSEVSGYPQGVPQHIMSGQARQGNVYGNSQQQKHINYKGRNTVLRRSQDNRRNFLWGLAAGSLSMLGITVAGRAILSHAFGGDDNASTLTQNPSTVSSTQATPSSGNATTTASGSTEIAQVSAVQPNSAVTFTIPSNGDPGVLIRLQNGKFVAFDATCTHAGCPVQYDSSSQHLLCPCHGAEFDPSHAAAVVQGPTNTPLTSVPITVNNSTGAITLQ
ncbi:MAG TPA: TQO small subunit DoxD [Ktedonobacteraceae bacterium]|nr:TQO small subunit DoxD [Ktedonobacteraceae bacterium]